MFDKCIMCDSTETIHRPRGAMHPVPFCDGHYADYEYGLSILRRVSCLPVDRQREILRQHFEYLPNWRMHVGLPSRWHRFRGVNSIA